MIDSTTRILALLLVYSFGKWCAVFTICTIYRTHLLLSSSEPKNLCNMSDVIPIDSDVRSGYISVVLAGQNELERMIRPHSPITFKGLHGTVQV